MVDAICEKSIKCITDFHHKLSNVAFEKEKLYPLKTYPGTFVSSAISKDTLQGISAQIHQEIKQELQELANVPFFKTLYKCSQILSVEKMVCALFDLTRSIDPVFKVYDKYSYGELLGYWPLVCSLLERYDIYHYHSCKEFSDLHSTCVCGFKLSNKEKLFVASDSSEMAIKFSLVTPGASTKTESLYEMEEILEALDRYVESAFDELELRQIPQLTKSFVVKFFDILLGFD